MTSITVVIPSYNRFQKLKETLDAISNQTVKPDLVIVVDDGSDNENKKQKRAFVGAYPYTIKLIEQVNSGAATATNRGVEEAPEGLIVLFDDDIIPGEDLLAKHIEHHEQYPGSLIFGSVDTDPSKVDTDVERYKLHMEHIWRNTRSDLVGKVKVEFHNFIITSANMSFDRETFQRLNGFNPVLRDGFDVDFGFRVLLSNVDLFYDTTLNAIHNDRITLRYYAARQKAYIESKEQIFKLNPNLLKLLTFSPRPHTTIIKKMLYTFLSRPKIVDFVEHSSLFLLLPKIIRYKIYGSTIAALSLKRNDS